MCLDFTKLDKAMILEHLEKLTNYKKKEDPVLGSKKPRDAIWATFPNRHGTLIQKSLLEFMRCINGWDGKVEFKFVTDSSTRDAFFDNLVFNKDFEIAILFECKRNIKNVSAPYEENFKRYEEICKLHAKDLTKELGFSGKKQKLFFSIFDAYGRGKNSHSKGIRITRPSDLSKLFPSCLSDAWASLEYEVASRLRKNEVSVSKEFEQRVKNALNLKDLEQRMTDDSNCEHNTPQKLVFSKFFGRSYI